MADYFSAIPFSILWNIIVPKRPMKAMLFEAFIKSSERRSKSYCWGKPIAKWENKTMDNRDEYKIIDAFIINFVLPPSCL